MKQNHITGLARFIGLMFLLTSLLGIFVVFYEALQPWWKENSEFFTSVFVAVPLPVQLERIGIFLQLLAGLSIIPELIGEKKLSENESFLKNFYSQMRQIRPLFPITSNHDGYVSNKLERRLVLATTILWMVAIIFMWIYPIFSSQPQYANIKKGMYSCFMLLVCHG